MFKGPLPARMRALHPCTCLTQAIYALAREADPNGERTIGVLTKVDLIELGTNVDRWFRYLRSEAYKLLLVRHALLQSFTMRNTWSCCAVKVVLRYTRCEAGQSSCAMVLQTCVYVCMWVRYAGLLHDQEPKAP